MHWTAISAIAIGSLLLALFLLFLLVKFGFWLHWRALQMQKRLLNLTRLEETRKLDASDDNLGDSDDENDKQVGGETD